MNASLGAAGGSSPAAGAAAHPITDRYTDPCFRAVFNSARHPMAVIGPTGRVLAANPAFGRLLDTPAEELTGLPVGELVPLGLDEHTRAACAAVLRGDCAQVTRTRRLKHPDGRPLWAEVTLVPAGAPGAPALLSVTDISEHRDLREGLRYLQCHDPLTRLPNRALFFQRLAAALADSATGRVGLCYLDLDGFTAVNDTLGHRAGDELLALVAQRLVHVTAGQRDGGLLVARLGGDEFALLVAGSTGTQQLTDLADAVLAGLAARPFELAGQRHTVSASVGVIERPTAGTSATELMRDAGTTLYWAKSDGKGRWTLYDAERSARRMRRQALSSALLPAVERGEFALEFQPIVGLADGTLRGVEALVRWQHPRLGTLAPGDFISLAEETGAIVPLGRWALAESCRQARRWQLEHSGVPPYVSVNVAVRQVWDSDLVADVAAVLRETGLPPGLLQLELTESAGVCPAGRPLRALHALSEMGVRIAIDDFGTGYSNLAYLSRLPVRALKLDGALVRGFHPGAGCGADEAIVATLVDLAHRLGLTVTAECVEEPAQAERLRLIGCDTGQGWHYSKPVAADRISALLARS